MLNAAFRERGQPQRRCVVIFRKIDGPISHGQAAMAQLLLAKRKEIKVARAQGGAFGALSP
jgi:hypothetical protein